MYHTQFILNAEYSLIEFQSVLKIYNMLRIHKLVMNSQNCIHVVYDF